MNTRDTGLAGKVAIVTGAGRGIGRTIALTFAGAGASVVAAARTAAEIEETVREIRAAGNKGLALPVDVTREEEIRGMVEKTVREFGQIDILVNNAGMTLSLPTVEMTRAQWDQIVSTNLISTGLCSQAVAGWMIGAGRGGKIINVASAGAHHGIPDHAAYCAAKGGVVALTRALAVEWAGCGITVNSISPGLVETRIAQTLKEKSPERFARRVGRIPLGYLGQVEDIAGLLLFLAREESGYITGQDIIIDGGTAAIHAGYDQA